MFCDEVDFSGVDFQYSVLWEWSGQKWTLDKKGTIFSDVTFRKSPVLKGAKGTWGINASNEISAQIREYSNAQIYKKADKDYKILKEALDGLFSELKQLEKISSEESEERNKEFWEKEKTSLKTFSASGLRTRLQSFFGESVFKSFRIVFMGPRWIEFIGFRESDCVGIQISCEGEDRFYAFGHTKF